MPGSLLGTAVRRVEDPELLRGEGSFVANLSEAADALHAVYVRSPFPHARITALDTAAALESPGVVAVLTAAELGTDPVPAFATANGDVGRSPVASDVVRFAGEPVALVVAATRAQAVDAVELVDVDYDPLPAVAGVEAALAPDAPLQWPALGSNVAASATWGDDDALADAEVVVRLRAENNRLAVAPMEGHAILVRPDDGRLTAWVSTQHPHLAQRLLAKVTGRERTEVRVVAPHVGGAFGGKAGMVHEHAAVALAAERLGRGVLWVETRSETMLSMHGRGQVQHAELGLTRDGRFTGLRIRTLGDCGAYAGFGGSLALGPTRMMAQGCYEVPRLQYEALAVLTNTAPVGAFRGAGRPEAAALLERLVDLAAVELDLPPEELRRRNLVPPAAFPFETRTGVTYDVGDFDLPLTEALRLADVDGARAEQRERRERGDRVQLGVGLAVYVEITGFGGSELGTVEVHPDGTATVSSGTSSHGQGHATSFLTLVSDRLGIPLADLTYLQSDTDRVRSGGGTGGSRSLQLGGSAVDRAAEETLEQARAVASRLLECDPSDVEAVDGGLGVRGVPDRAVDWAAVAAAAHEQEGGLGVAVDEKQEGATFPFGAHVSIVEVDTETGFVRPRRHVAVDDCGRVVNPLIVQGQQHGGAVQGIAQALWEEMVYSPDGTPLTSTFADYTLPTAADTIALEVSGTEKPTPLNRLGAKGIGESATIGSTPAVQNAVVDALSHLGVRHVDLPCTPVRVWDALRAASAGPVDPWREPPERFAELLNTDGDGPDEVDGI